ncbi:ATP-binding protein [Streptomyces sp. NPDC093544]|uniref:ATP-binding protein n=1 Tax=Streptomyces sp. NPDC093544 TaxID=3155200 RepID=UPI003412FADA
MNPTNPSVRPTPVALYACIHDATDPFTVMRSLHETATDHGWKVAASLYDTGPLTRPPARRLAWRTVTELLAARKVHGVVTPDSHHVDLATLTAHGAFAEYRTLTPLVRHPHHYRTTLPADPALVREARHTIRARLAEWHVSEDTAQTAELILSELLTNAVIHTTGPDITVEVSHPRHDEVLVAVTDHSPTHPSAAPSPHPARDEHGRGLHLIEALATSWGTTPAHDGAGKTVWARIPAPS